MSFTTAPHNTSNMTNDTIDHCRGPNEVTYKVLSWLMMGEFALGLPLNLSVLYVFIFRYKFWKNKSIFLFNIVVADFLLVVCLPVKIHHYQQNMRRSPDTHVCKLMLSLLFLNRGASISFLIILSMDRYFNVVHLGRKNCVQVLKKSPQISIIVWLLLLPLTIPTMVQTFECCNSHGRKVETYLHDVTDTVREVVFFSQIIIPFFILLYCSVHIIKRLRRKSIGEKKKLKKAVWAVLSVVVVFSFCFLPCAIARAVLLAVRLQDWQNTENLVVQAYDTLMVLSYTDCLLDPLVYCFCNSGFKNAYITTFFPTSVQNRLIKSSDLSNGNGNTTVSSGAKTVTLHTLEK